MSWWQTALMYIGGWTVFAFVCGGVWVLWKELCYRLGEEPPDD